MGLEMSPVNRYSDRVETFGALLDEPITPVPWRCDGYMVDGTLTMTCGRAGTYKTQFGIQLADGVQRGVTTAGIRCEQGNAGIADFEMGRELYKMRLRASGLTTAEARTIPYIRMGGRDLAKP
jgi:hypothetical protein